ncbi:hypothetical protein FP2506_01813 [Fulvimarina pelagi HTCC2506]|uniref:Uncharacterized protein n=1 Tax=Fulvimarina pelagi HTCC2506 TaxID=314231 RepID=Q0FXH2_9HYPH|nr:hypothetical protein FP2506_01813 [Fulvimarina pelagi HTCC2506]
MTLDVLGINLAESAFQLHGVNAADRVVLKRRVACD